MNIYSFETNLDLPCSPRRETYEEQNNDCFEPERLTEASRLFISLKKKIYTMRAGGSGVGLGDGPDMGLFILVGLGRSFFACCLAHRDSTVGFLLLQCSSGVVRHPRDLQVSVATHFCRVLIFASS